MRLGSLVLLLFFAFVQLFNSCKTVDQTTPQLRFEVETNDTVILMTNKHADMKIDISGDPIKWTATASDINRIQSISFYYKNLRMEFPNGLEGVDTVNRFFTVGGQTIGQLTFNLTNINRSDPYLGWPSMMWTAGQS